MASLIVESDKADARGTSGDCPDGPQLEIGARLDHVQLTSPNPERCARFYGRTYGMYCEPVGPSWLCSAEQRRLLFTPGPANCLGFAAFAFTTGDALEVFRRQVASKMLLRQSRSPLSGWRGFAVTDPDGNEIEFGVRDANSEVRSATAGVHEAEMPARLQHVAVRSTQLATLAAFYRDMLGFIVSDSVLDESGRARAYFLRTDCEHHAIALFHAEKTRHDHLSFETSDWDGLRKWADRISRLSVPIAWGIGRHGPGNDTFFMVHDPDGNLAEISAELEVCSAGRAERTWPHEDRTFNLWGGALLRV